MSYYNGWLIVSMPTTPTAPASLEFQQNAITGASTNPFTGQQQIYNWSAGYKEGSVSMPPMDTSDGQNWTAFLESCNGMANVFTFPSGVCSAYPNELTTDGTTPRYFRLKSNSSKWQIKQGGIYSIVFEFREAI
jgi:hypothetical protein